MGSYTYRDEAARTGVAPVLAFAPGRARHTLCFEAGFADRWTDLVEALGPHRSSVACLYVTRLANVDLDVLRAMLERSMAETLAR